jgi:ribonuclease HII
VVRGAAAVGPGPIGGRRPGPSLWFERRLWLGGRCLVAGADEVGRGPLAGPVVAAAVIFPPEVREADLAGLDDSKRLSPEAREALVPRIRALALAWAVAEVDVEEIDRLNIAQASFEAVRRAVAALRPAPEHVLVDGLPNPRLVPLPQTALVGGDGLSLSVAAASVLAKVHRDRCMVAWDAVYPGYGFAEHKGYPTPEHRRALGRLGPCPLHRRSFRLQWDEA